MSRINIIVFKLYFSLIHVTISKLSDTYIWWRRNLRKIRWSKKRFIRKNHTWKKVTPGWRRQGPKKISVVENCSLRCFYLFPCSARLGPKWWPLRVPRPLQSSRLRIHRTCTSSFWLTTSCLTGSRKHILDFPFQRQAYAAWLRLIWCKGRTRRSGERGISNSQTHISVAQSLNRSSNCLCIARQLAYRRIFPRWF